MNGLSKTDLLVMATATLIAPGIEYDERAVKDEYTGVVSEEIHVSFKVPVDVAMQVATKLITAAEEAAIASR